MQIHSGDDILLQVLLSCSAIWSYETFRRERTSKDQTEAGKHRKDTFLSNCSLLSANKRGRNEEYDDGRMMMELS